MTRGEVAPRDAAAGNLAEVPDVGIANLAAPQWTVDPVFALRASGKAPRT